LRPTRWDPVSLNNGYGKRKRSINHRDPFRKGTGLFLMSPADTGTVLTTAFFLQLAGAPYAKEIARDAFPEKVWEAKLTSNVAGLTINSPTKLTFLP
jgi:hypothetical protein